MNKEERLIQIPLEEYKELLIIRGRYEELIKKEIRLPKQTITYIDGVPIRDYKFDPPYKITCNTEDKNK